MPKLTQTVESSSKSAQQVRRKRKAATNAIREIRQEQKNTGLIIPVAPMNRLISEVAKECKADLRFKSDAYTALHTAAENYLIELFQESNKCAIHNYRETVQPRDLKLARDLSSSQ